MVPKIHRFSMVNQPTMSARCWPQWRTWEISLISEIPPLQCTVWPNLAPLGCGHQWLKIFRKMQKSPSFGSNYISTRICCIIRVLWSFEPWCTSFLGGCCDMQLFLSAKQSQFFCWSSCTNHSFPLRLLGCRLMSNISTEDPHLCS